MASDYVVFRAEQIDLEPDDVWTAWKEIGRASAATPKAAIKAVTDGKPAAERTGTFVATPARSWQPMARKGRAGRTRGLGMSRYRKKPVVIEARRFGAYTEAIGPEPWNDGGGHLWKWLTDSGVTFVLGQDPDGRAYLNIGTLEGVMRADVGDWIIQGVAGEFYPCKPDIFDATYEAE